MSEQWDESDYLNDYQIAYLLEQHRKRQAEILARFTLPPIFLPAATGTFDPLLDSRLVSREPLIPKEGADYLEYWFSL